MKTTMRAVLALSLLIGFYLLVLAVVAVDITAMVLLVTLPTSVNQARLLGIPSNAVTTIAFSAPMLAAIFYGVFTVSWRDAPIFGSVVLRRSQAPELWETVTALADEVGTRPPTEIRLIGEANAMVTEESYLLGLFPGQRRVLYIGVPLLVALSADELRAVLGHELGHYARKHTRLAAIVYRGSISLRTTLERLTEAAGGGRRRYWGGFSAYLYLLLSAYARFFHRLAFAVNRRQELEADEAAADIVSPEVMAEALRAVHAVGVSWATFDGQILAPMRLAGRQPDDPFSAYQRTVEIYRDEFARLRYEIPQEPDKPLDSHPSLAKRLHTLGGLPEQIVELDPRRALDLMVEYQDPFERVRSGLYVANPRPMPWEDWLKLAAESRAIEPARALRRAESRLTASTNANTTKRTGQPLLATVLSRLEAGQSRELARHLDDALGINTPDERAEYSDVDLDEVDLNLDALDPNDPNTNTSTDNDESAAITPDGYPGRLLAALLSLVGQGLVEIGAAAWDLSWTGATVLVPRDITADELVALLAAAVLNPLEVPRLRLHLAGLGLDENAQITLSEKNAKPGSLKINPATDGDAARRRTMATAAIVTMFGLLIALGILGSATASKRSQVAASLYGQQSLQQPVPEYSYNAYPNVIIPSYAPRLLAPSINPSYLVHLMPPITLVPSDFVSTITVRSGETLSSIARDCDTTVADLQRINEMGSSTQIDAGQTLKIPEAALLLPDACN